MSDYSRQQDFSTKTGTVILGSEVDSEFDALLTAVNSKVDESRESAANGIATLDGSALIPAGISGDPDSGGGQMPEASATSLGAVELANITEARTLSDPLRVITADTLNDVLTANGGHAKHLQAISGLGGGGDKLFMFDDTDDTLKTATLGTGISITGTTVSLDDGEILHDSLSGFVADEHIAHSGVSVIAGAGMTGGGTIAASRTLNVIGGSGITVNADDLKLDITGLAAVEGGDLVTTDGFLVDSNGTNKRMAYRDAGVPIVAVADTTDILNTADMNSFIKYTNAAGCTVTLNNAVGKKGNVLMIQQGAAGAVTIAGSATIETADSLLNTRTQDSVMVLVCTDDAASTNTWTLFGDRG
jgi:hypothetical protein